MSPLSSSSELSVSETSNVQSVGGVGAKPTNANYHIKKSNNSNSNSNSNTVSCSHSLPMHWTHYTPLRVLGAGGFGIVYLCANHYYGTNDSVSTKYKERECADYTTINNNKYTHRGDNKKDMLSSSYEKNISSKNISLFTEEYVAVKAISLSELTDEEVMLTMNEVALLEHLHHPNIIRYLDCFMDSELQQLCLVTEYVDGGDVAQMIKAAKRKKEYSICTPNKKSKNGKMERNAEQQEHCKKHVQEYQKEEWKEEEAAIAEMSIMETNDESAAHNNNNSKDKHREKRPRENMCETYRSKEDSLFAKRQHVKLNNSSDPFTSCENNYWNNTSKEELGNYSNVNKSFEVTWMSDASYCPSTPMSATAWWEAESCNNHITTTTINKTSQVIQSTSNYEKKSIKHETNKDESKNNSTNSNLQGLKERVEHLNTHNSEEQEEEEQWIASFTIIDILRQCLEGLKYLHTLHILHRDIKPSNIYITQRGQVKIGDFGIAKLLNHDDPFTNTFIGTPFYLSPELCWGEPYSFTSDIWSLGVVGYELYTLHLPFTAHNVLAQIHCVTEGQYDHVLLERSHFFSPSQAHELAHVYGYDAIAKESVLHKLLVRLVESMLTNAAAERLMANELLETYFQFTSTVEACEYSVSNKKSINITNCNNVVKSEGQLEQHCCKCIETHEHKTNAELSKLCFTENSSAKSLPDLFHGNSLEQGQNKEYECKMQIDLSEGKGRPRSRWREMFSRHGKNKNVNNMQNESKRSNFDSNALQSEFNHINAWESSWGNEGNMEVSTNFVQLTTLSTLSNSVTQEKRKKEIKHTNETGLPFVSMNIKCSSSSDIKDNEYDSVKQEDEESTSLLSSLANRVQCSFGALCSFLPLSRRENVIHGARLWSRRHSHQRLGMQSINNNKNNIDNTNTESKYVNHIIPSSNSSASDANYVPIREERSNSVNRNEINILTLDSNENYNISSTAYINNNITVCSTNNEDIAVTAIGDVLDNTNESIRNKYDSYFDVEHTIVKNAFHHGSNNTNNNLSSTQQVNKSIENNMQEKRREEEDNTLSQYKEGSLYEEDAIPWLHDAEAFQAIPLSEGSEDVVLVERAQQNSISIHGDVVVINKSNTNNNFCNNNNTVSGVANTVNNNKNLEDKTKSTIFLKGSSDNNNNEIQEMKKEDHNYNEELIKHEIDLSTSPQPKAFRLPSVVDVNSQINLHSENRQHDNITNRQDRENVSGPELIAQKEKELEYQSTYKNESDGINNIINETKSVIVVRSMSRRGQPTRTELYPKSQLLEFKMNESNKTTLSSTKSPELNQVQQNRSFSNNCETNTTMTSVVNKPTQQTTTTIPIQTSTSSLSVLGMADELSCSKLTNLLRAKVRTRQLQQRFNKQYQEIQQKQEKEENLQEGKTQNKLNDSRAQDGKKVQFMNNNAKYTITTLPSASMQSELDLNAKRSSLRQELTELYKQTYHSIWANHHRRKVGVVQVPPHEEAININNWNNKNEKEMNSKCNSINDCMSVHKKMLMSDHSLMSTRTLPFYYNDHDVQTQNKESMHEKPMLSQQISNDNKIENVNHHKVSMESENPLGITLTQGKHALTSPLLSLHTSQQSNLVDNTLMERNTEEELQNTKQYVLETSEQSLNWSDKTVKKGKAPKEHKTQHMTELPSTTLHLYPPKELNATCVYHEKTDNNSNNNNNNNNEAFIRQQRRLSNEMKVRNKLRRRTSAPQQRLNTTLSSSSSLLLNNTSSLQENNVNERELKENVELSIVGIRSKCNKPVDSAKPNSNNKQFRCKNECLPQWEQNTKNTITSKMIKEENENEQLRLCKSSEHRIRPICSAPLSRTRYNHNLTSNDPSVFTDTTTTKKEFDSCHKNRNSGIDGVNIPSVNKEQTPEEQEKNKEQNNQEKTKNNLCKSTHNARVSLTPPPPSSSSSALLPCKRRDEPSRELLDTTIESILNEAQTRRYIQKRCKAEKKNEHQNNNYEISHSAEHTNLFDNTHSANSLSSHYTFNTNTSCNSMDKYGLSDNLESEQRNFTECNVSKLNNTINCTNINGYSTLHDEVETTDASCAMLEIIHAARQAATIDVNVANFAKHEPPRLAISENALHTFTQNIHYDKDIPCLWESSSVEDDSENINECDVFSTSNLSNEKAKPHKVKESITESRNNVNQCNQYMLNKEIKESRRGVPHDRPDKVQVTYKRRLSASLTASSSSSSSSSSTSTSSETSSLCSLESSQEANLCNNKDKQHEDTDEECTSVARNEEHHESDSSLEDHVSDVQKEQEGESVISDINSCSDNDNRYSNDENEDDSSNECGIFDLEIYSSSWNVTNSLPMFVIHNQEATEVRSFDSNSDNNENEEEEEYNVEESLDKGSLNEVDANNDCELMAENAITSTSSSESSHSSSSSSSSEEEEEESLTLASSFIYGGVHGSMHKCSNDPHYYAIEWNKKTRRRFFDYNLPVTLEIVTQLPLSLIDQKEKIVEEGLSLTENESIEELQEKNNISESNEHQNKSSQESKHDNIQNKANREKSAESHEHNLHICNEKNSNANVEQEVLKEELLHVEHNNNCEKYKENDKSNNNVEVTNETIASDKVMRAKITSDQANKTLSQVNQMKVAATRQLPLDKELNELSVIGVSKPINHNVHVKNELKTKNATHEKQAMEHASSVLSNTNTTAGKVNHHDTQFQHNREMFNKETSKQKLECAEHDVSGRVETSTARERIKTSHTIPLRPVRSRTRLSGLLWRIRCALHSFGLSSVAQNYIPPHLVNGQHTMNHSANFTQWKQCVNDSVNTDDVLTEKKESKMQNKIHNSSSSSSQTQSNTEANITDITEQLALMPLYFYERSSELVHEQILIQINSEVAWQTVQELWSDKFAQRPFMRLHLVVGTPNSFEFESAEEWS